MSYLEGLLAATRARVAEAKARVSQDVLEQRVAAAGPPRGFARALVAGDEVAIIAEVKRASPAWGALDLDLNAGQLARAYAEGGAAAISVLTEPDHFRGSLEDLEAASVAGLPLLRKDFTIDPFQVLEARAAGADAVLVIVKAVGSGVGPLLSAARAFGIDALTEVHDEAELELALDAGADLVGVNHRDLDTFEVDPERTVKLAPLIPPGRILVGLSGVSTRAQVEELGAAGAAAVLVGESLVTAPDPVAALRALRGAA
jgi:indole-3-glycerol phosphate synthase